MLRCKSELVRSMKENNLSLFKNYFIFFLSKIGFD